MKISFEIPAFLDAIEYVQKAFERLAVELEKENKPRKLFYSKHSKRTVYAKHRKF